MYLLREYLASRGPRVADLQRQLTATKAIGPENGGQGEAEKAALISVLLAAANVPEIISLPSPDPRVESGMRPNLVARIPGASPRTLWLFGHMDVVPAGDPADWDTDPWQAVQKNGFIFGRGTEDNQQALVSMLLLAEGLNELRLKPPLTLGLVFMSDEESGSRHGLDWILRSRPDIFSPNDLYIVPDGGSPDGADIEIAEKAQLWLKFEVSGKQCHASTPNNGVNAFLGAASFVVLLNTLNEIFSATDPLFLPPVSTFAPTRHDQNSAAVNIIPGRDVFYMDCRLLPSLPVEEVMKRVSAMTAAASARYRIGISTEIIQNEPATATAPDSPVVAALQGAIRNTLKLQPRLTGIGGATVASFLRRRNLPAAVWATLRNTCHQANECSSISATCLDAEVFAHILSGAADA